MANFNFSRKLNYKHYSLTWGFANVSFLSGNSQNSILDKKCLHIKTKIILNYLLQLIFTDNSK